MVIAIPSLLQRFKGWHARPGKETVTINLFLQERSITLRNGACPIPDPRQRTTHVDRNVATTNNTMVDPTN